MMWGDGAASGPLSVRFVQNLIEVAEEFLPAGASAAERLSLLRSEARLLDAQMRAGTRRRQRKRHHALEIVGRVVMDEIPAVGQRLVRLDGEHLAIQHSAPFAAKVEAVAHLGLEVVLHQPLLDQMRLRQRAPELFRWKGELAFDDDSARFGRLFVHWSILFSKSSSRSNRFCQKPAIWLLQSISGASAPSCAL